MDLERANSILEAQRAALCSADELMREALLWRGATPEECWAALEELCAAADYYLSLLAPDQLERALEPDPLPADTQTLIANFNGTG